MEEDATRKKELLDLYRRAAEADPRDGTTLADYGRYVYVRLQDFDQAEPLLLAALKLDPHCEVALYHLGNLIYRYVQRIASKFYDVYLMMTLCFYRERKNLDAAEILFKKLLAKNPIHGNGTVALARVYADKVQALQNDKHATPDKVEEYIQEAIDHYEKSVTLVKEVIQTFITYKKLKSLIHYVYFPPFSAAGHRHHRVLEVCDYVRIQSTKGKPFLLYTSSMYEILILCLIAQCHQIHEYLRKWRQAHRHQRRAAQQGRLVQRHHRELQKFDERNQSCHQCLSRVFVNSFVCI